MDLATGAIGSIISKLADLLKAEYKLQTGVKAQIESLRHELQSAHAFLQEIDKVQPEHLNGLVNIWAGEVKEASYDIEDILDTFLVRVNGAPEPSSSKKKLEWLLEKMGSLFSKTKARHDIARAMEEVNRKVKEIDERRRRYKLDNRVASPAAPSSRIDPRIALVHRTNMSLLVGIDERRDAVTRMLADDGGGMSARKTKVVSLLGFAGVGKTTLAKATYDQLKQEYKWRAFVSVGQKPDLAKVFKDILFHLDRVMYEQVHSRQKGADYLISELLEFLRDKRYLIVVDDVWETKTRRRIIEVLPENNIGSRILITTRNSEVSVGEVYKVQPLSEDKSKTLFYTRVFGVDDNCLDNEQQKVSKFAHKILRKCGGVPLAIITMGSLLVGKSMQEWIEVCNSIGFQDKDKEQLDDTMWILSLSYYDLPSHLKTCLLYLSVFPENYLIKKDSLIWMWIAEGFVKAKPGIGMFDIGEGYFNDLINRNLIQPVEEKESRIVEGCVVHDMILDLIRSLSREANFATVSDNGEETLLGSSDARRLALQNRVLVDTHHNHNNHKDNARARSFIVFRCSFGSWVPLQSFKFLRVLCLEGCRRVYFDEHVGDLLHLRCLVVRNAYFFKLPREIGALKFVLVLYLEGIELFLEDNRDASGSLPSSVGMLTRLVCLRVWGTSLPSGLIIKDLTSLQELKIDLGDDDTFISQLVKDLGNLRELRELKISGKLMDERTQSDLFKSLGNLHKMQRLELLGGFDCCNQGLLSYIDPSHLPNLSHLSLTLVRVDDQCLKILGGLPELCYLQLFTWGGRATIAATATDTHGYFLKLRSCLLPDSMIQFVVNEDDSSVSFTIWHRSDDAPEFAPKLTQDSCRAAARSATVMPNLEALYFRVHVRELTACENGSHDNLGLEHLTSLQKVRIDLDCWDALVDVVEEEEVALRNAIQIHPNRPTLEIKFYGKL
ncbi:hypothetical protein BS78_05G256100 [Paspalum vaginatum]|nr:hypothetical protein BS78_05G256100 [Paspalum vaginatum]